jgi:aquaporin Z
MFGRRKIAALAAEFLGTSVLTLLVLSVQRSTIGVPFFVAIAAGLSVIIMTFAVGSTSGAFFNPAITIAMWTARKVSTLTAVLYIAMEFLGGWASYAIYKYLSHAPLAAVGGHFSGRILVAEAIGTGIFAFGLAGVVYQRFSAAAAATIAGLAFTVGIIAASPAAIGILNPAVALGIRAWVWGTYVLGPVLGAVIGLNLYGLLFAEPGALATVGAGASAEAVVFSKTTTATAVAAPKKRTTKKSAAKKTTRAKK